MCSIYISNYLYYLQLIKTIGANNKIIEETNERKTGRIETLPISTTTL